ncbi:MAG: gfo/Idh/MocA family oxidoreductase [Planctomycetota bacterium]|nr:MAG: gfo/Idh/MocA family oxidoreductase [Planctomycetota bacterium]
MSPRPLAIGFVGSGFITRFHIQSLIAVRDCTVAAVAGRHLGRAQEACQLAKDLSLGNPKAYDDVASMVADPNVDAIWICATNDSRIPVMEAIAAGHANREQPLKGIACEKPLARNLREALQLQQMAEKLGVATGYLEDMVFAPHLQRGKEIIWRRAVPIAGRPYLARAAEEHGGPHSAWFWQGEVQGGGALLDMMCHSLEAARWLLTEPGAPRNSLTPIAVSATIAGLKWTQPRFAEVLQQRYGGSVDFHNRPSEDFSRATVIWQTEDGQELLTEVTDSWSYVGAGLRHTFELQGPEYAMNCDLGRTGLEVFLSREIRGEAGEDLVEKQNAEQGLMPVAPDETSHYGYVGENRHFVQAFQHGHPAELDFQAGVDVTRLMMACYWSAEEGRTVDPRDPHLEDFVPAVARGTWKAQTAGSRE